MQLTIPQIPLPPRALRNHDDDLYAKSAVWNLKKLSTLIPLHPGMRILEIGCAAGRLALPLLDFLDGDAGGSYEGIDINPAAITWARTHIATNWPHFSFRHLDVKHQVSNPEGHLNASDVDLGLQPTRYELIMLHSVYTHLLPRTIESYTRQIAKALVSGGHVYLTLFEWDDEARASYSAGICSREFDHDLGGVRVMDPELPTAAVAVESDFLRSTMESNGLLREAEVRGGWRTGNKGAQDIAIYRLSSDASRVTEREAQAPVGG